MEFLDYSTGKDDETRRVDKVLRKFLPDHQLSEIYKLIRKGLIRVNNIRIKQDYRITAGDIINVAAFLINESLSEKNENDFSFDIPVLFHNEYLLAVNKPYDITVHGSKDSLDEKVKKYFKSEGKSSSLSFSPGPLHRLDRKTTGLLVFSWSLEGAHWFSEKIATHEISKIYWGIVEGHLPAKERWENLISKDDETGNDFFHTVSESPNTGKKAVTVATPLGYGRYKGKDITLAEFNIETGRTHQIRFQSSSHGYPLLGDNAYGGTKTEEKQDFFLHARKLIFPENPVGLPEELEAPLPASFKKLLNEKIILV